MQTHRWLRHVTILLSATVGRAPTQPTTGAIRGWAASGILALALLPGGLGVAASTAPGHAASSHVHAAAHKSAGGHAASTAASSLNSGLVSRPWMF